MQIKSVIRIRKLFVLGKKKLNGKSYEQNPCDKNDIETIRVCPPPSCEWLSPNMLQYSGSLHGLWGVY